MIAKLLASGVAVLAAIEAAAAGMTPGAMASTGFGGIHSIVQGPYAPAPGSGDEEDDSGGGSNPPGPNTIAISSATEEEIAKYRRGVREDDDKALAGDYPPDSDWDGTSLQETSSAMTSNFSDRAASSPGGSEPVTRYEDRVPPEDRLNVNADRGVPWEPDRNDSDSSSYSGYSSDSSFFSQDAADREISAWVDCVRAAAASEDDVDGEH
jgi:hypothetical protein